MVKQILGKGNIPQWATTIMVGMLGFFMVLYVNSSQAQNDKQDTDISKNKELLSDVGTDVKLLDQCLKSNVAHINDKLTGIVKKQQEMAGNVSDNSKRLDRITFILEQMAVKQGIK